MKKVLGSLALGVGVVGLVVCMKGWYLFGSAILVVLGLLGLCEE